MSRKNLYYFVLGIYVFCFIITLSTFIVSIFQGKMNSWCFICSLWIMNSIYSAYSYEKLYIIFQEKT